MSSAPAEHSPAACWSLLGPPWPSRLGALQRSSWKQPHDAFEPAQELAAFVVELARQLDPSFPAGLPKPPSRSGFLVDDLSVPARGERGLAWHAQQKAASRLVERRLVLEAVGLSDGREIKLTWRDIAAPPGVFKSRRELELEVVASPEERHQLEAAVEAMLREGRPPRPTPAAADSTAPRGPLRRREYLAVGLVVTLVAFAGLRLASDGFEEIQRWRHVDHYAPVEGSAVAVRLVNLDDAWTENSRLGAELAPEIEVAYELKGTRSLRFVDTSIHRQTPAIVRSLGESAWLGRPITLWADPHTPWLATREKPSNGAPSLWRLVVGLLLVSPLGVLAAGYARERFSSAAAATSTDTSS